MQSLRKQGVILALFILLLLSGCILKEKIPYSRQVAESDSKFVEIDSYYNVQDIRDPVDIGGKLAFRVVGYYSRDFLYGGVTGYDHFIVYDGQELGKQYEEAYPPFDVGGKPAFAALSHRDSTSRSIVFYDGKELGKDYDSVDISSPKNVGGKLAISVRRGGKWFVLYDNQEIGGDKNYDGIRNIIDVGGKPAFIAEREGYEYVFYDNKEFGGYTKVGGAGIAPLANIDGKLAYTSSITIYNGTLLTAKSRVFYDVYRHIPLKTDYYLFYDGKNLSGSLDYLINADYISEPENIGGKLAFVIRKGPNFSVWYDSKIYGDYAYISDLKSVQGKLVFTVGKDIGNRRTHMVVYDGNPLKTNYDLYEDLKEIGGKLTFRASRPGGAGWTYVHDGKDLGEGFDGVEKVIDVGGKPAFVASTGKDYFVKYDDKEFGPYSRVPYILTVNGKLVFIGYKNESGIVVMEK